MGGMVWKTKAKTGIEASVKPREMAALGRF
jgi:hypothetical protein